MKARPQHGTRRMGNKWNLASPKTGDIEELRNLEMRKKKRSQGILDSRKKKRKRQILEKDRGHQVANNTQMS